MKQLFLLIVLAFALGGKLSVVHADDPLQVVATTSIIADVAQAVGGDLVEVTSVIPPGGDPHSYIPSPREVVTIIDADLVLVNGMDLEENLLGVVEDNASSDPVVVSMGVPVLSSSYHEEEADDEHDHDSETDHDHDPFLGVLGEDPICDTTHEGDEDHDDEHDHEGDEDHEDEHDHEEEEDHEGHDHGPCDPHVWMAPGNVMLWASNIADAYIALDPDNMETYQTNAENYIQELETLDQDIQDMVEGIPESNRVLVTNHIFLSYFAVAYDFEIAGVILPGGGAAAEVAPRTLVQLIEQVNDLDIPAIFGEESVSSDLAETVANEADHEVQVVLLYTGALSDTDGPASTYLDYMRYNATLIVEALARSEE